MEGLLDGLGLLWEAPGSVVRLARIPFYGTSGTERGMELLGADLLSLTSGDVCSRQVRERAVAEVIRGLFSSSAGEVVSKLELGNDAFRNEIEMTQVHALRRAGSAGGVKEADQAVL